MGNINDKSYCTHGCDSEYGSNLDKKKMVRIETKKQNILGIINFRN
jgi:hypothetical protein